jgi:osmotically-inducible protein OsmY
MTTGTEPSATEISDADLEDAVEAQLRSDKTFDSADITVAVKYGVVTLGGFTRSFRQRRRAVAAVERVKGVAGIVNDIEVRLPLLHTLPDPEIARQIVQMFRLDLAEAAENLTVTVQNGIVTLEGEVETHFELEEAELVARLQPGVRRVSNLIRLRPHPPPDDVKRRIEEALNRNAITSAAEIDVEVNGSEVTLRGIVGSFVQRAEAERVAWELPGVTRVQNEIRVAT